MKVRKQNSDLMRGGGGENTCEQEGWYTKGDAPGDAPTSHPAMRKSAILDIGTKYATWGLPVVAVPQYNFSSLS